MSPPIQNRKRVATLIWRVLEQDPDSSITIAMDHLLADLAKRKGDAAAAEMAYRMADVYVSRGVNGR